MASMREEDRLLSALDDRLSALEKTVVVGAEKSDGKLDGDMTHTVNDALKRLKDMVAKHENLRTMFEKYGDVEEMLNSADHEDALQTEMSKAESVLVSESRIRDLVASLEAFSRVKDEVNPPGVLEELPQMNVKLKPLEAVHLSQIDLAEKQQGQVVALLETYNSIMLTLSKSFVAWDAILTQLEKTQK